MNQAGGLTKAIVGAILLAGVGWWTTAVISRSISDMLTGTFGTFGSFGLVEDDQLRMEQMWQSFGLPLWICMGVTVTFLLFVGVMAYAAHLRIIKNEHPRDFGTIDLITRGNSLLLY